MEHTAQMTEMAKAGAHVGYSRSRTHPTVRPHLLGLKNGIAVVDLAKTESMLARAKEFLSSLGTAGKKVLLVGNKPEMHSLVRDAAKKIGCPYVCRRWIGGTFTNATEIRRRVARYNDLVALLAGPEAQKYTKQERNLFEKERVKLEITFEGILEMRDLPAAVLLVDSRHEKNALAEARKAGVPIVSISGTDSDLRAILYPVLANDSARTSVKYFLEELVGAYEQGHRTYASGSGTTEKAA